MRYFLLAKQARYINIYWLKHKLNIITFSLFIISYFYNLFI